MSATSLLAQRRPLLWSMWVVVAFLLLPLGDGPLYFALVTGTALALAVLPGAVPHSTRVHDAQDLVAIAALYVAVVALMTLAFQVFTTGNVLGLFLCFAAALLLGVAGPVYYTVWIRGRQLSDLGFRRDNLRSAAGYALLFGGIQFALTLWGLDLPTPVDWVPLLCMSLVVGVFESFFFRGFIQGCLERQLGTAAGVGAAALLYGLYHVGYGMRGGELLFLTGLGVVYAVAFAIARNLVVLWPLLTPLGSFFANVKTGDIELPWASIAGFLDVLALMALFVWLAARHQRRLSAGPEATQPAGTGRSSRRELTHKH